MRLDRYDEVNPTKEQRRAFDCGVEGLNEWLRGRARRSMESRDAVTSLLMDGDVIAGYFCLSAGSVSKDSMPGTTGRDAPNPVPVILMGRFAVDVTYQGRGLGADLLREAFLSAVKANEAIGARAFLVDTIDDKAKSFYLRYGFETSPINPLQLMYPMAAIVASLAAALAPENP